ncbi:MAG: hypothetical protein EZS28_029211, partial [Streblomastix strix]
MNGILKIIKQ